MRRTAAGLAAAALLLSGCGGGAEPSATPSAPATSAAPATTSPRPTPAATPTPAPTSEPPTPAPTATAPAPGARVRAVLAISVDGLNETAIDQLGHDGAPAFWRLLDEGAATRNARTEVEQTVTLPNHTGMLTGRRIDAGQGGHGVTWNDEIPGRTVPGSDGSGVESVFDVVHDAGGTTAMFAGKDKFATFQRSWPDAIDLVDIDPGADALVAATIADLVGERRRFTFLHLALPDLAGHATGWMSPAYVAAVGETDRLLGELLDTIDATPRLSRRLVVVLTADHGGPPGERDHDDAADPADFTIPFLAWGRGIGPGDLYALNPGYRDPGEAQPAYADPPPVRNGDVANLATDLLGLGPVPGSELDAAQDLEVGP